jgi:hypothetical protein
MSNLLCISFSSQAQGDADAVHGLIAPTGLTLVGVTLYPEAFTGTPTGFTVDVNVGETEAVKALAANTAGTAGEWKAGHLGGSKAAVAIPTGAVVTLDVNLAGGTTPTADYDVHLWLLEGTA